MLALKYMCAIQQGIIVALVILIFTLLSHIKKKVFVLEHNLWNRGKCSCGRTWQRMGERNKYGCAYSCEPCRRYFWLKYNFEENTDVR